MTNHTTNPLEGTNGQLMAMAAHSYCLGRRTYIVTSCVEWLMEWWGMLADTTRNVIMRDTIIALQDNAAGSSFDRDEWVEFAEWAWDRMNDWDRFWCKSEVAYRGKPWPLKEHECCGGCGKHAANCNEATGN